MGCEFTLAPGLAQVLFVFRMGLCIPLSSSLLREVRVKLSVPMGCWPTLAAMVSQEVRIGVRGQFSGLRSTL